MNERDKMLLNLITDFMENSKSTSYKVSGFKNQVIGQEFTKITINFVKDVDK